MQIYYIGGSPCSGKSTVAEALAKLYGLAYFKADDHLDDFISRGAAAGLPVCQRIRRMSADETWLRPPQVQCQEELDFYAEIAPFVTEKLAALNAPHVITEGAAFLPCLAKDAAHYIAITPSWEFQVSRYRERPWVPHVLRNCSDKELAFANWMERDCLFAEEVRRQCAQLRLPHMLTDGSISPEECLCQVASLFHLDE
ncbi:MAG: hypothetical protein IJO39_09430 [Clostridia bacterium]|nr:hypothetical protein [Clostridia bacterium]